MTDPIALFSDSAAQAHAAFMAAARDAGAEVEEFRHPLPGPDGEALHVGVASVGPKGAANVLLILSGTHGVESFAGAAIQTGLLRELVDHPLPPDVALLLVHQINPWGTAWSRREDQDNVDLFRNFLYHDAPSTPDPLFDAWDQAVDFPNLMARPPEETAARLQALADQHGAPALISAVRRGQHHRPKSMSWHGDGPTWSTRVLERVLRGPRLDGCRRLGVLDIHTGFGVRGEGLVMSYDADGDPRQDRVARWMEEPLYLPGNDADIPPHARSPYSRIAALRPGLEVTAAILEFGTLPADEIRELFLKSHHLHLYGDPLSEEGVGIRKAMRRFCYLEEDSWKRAVWPRGAAVARRMAAGLADWAREAGS
jgi:hypothetical protein